MTLRLKSVGKIIDDKDNLKKVNFELTREEASIDQ